MELMLWFPLNFLIAWVHSWTSSPLFGSYGCNGTEKVTTPILTLAYPQFYLSLFLSPGRPDGKSKKDGEEKENERESVSERCLLSSGERGHSVPQTFRQINLMTRLENSGEARSRGQKNHTQHPPHTARTQTSLLLPTHSSFADKQAHRDINKVELFKLDMIPALIILVETQLLLYVCVCKQICLWILVHVLAQAGVYLIEIVLQEHSP